MRIIVSEHDGTPIYAQIVRQVKYLVASGRLEEGEKLPSVRRLAEQLVVNPNTVARAYRELEAADVVVTRRGAGVFVARNGSRLSQRERTRILTERIDALLVEARQLDVDGEALRRLMDEREQRLLPAPNEETHAVTIPRAATREERKTP